MNAASTHDGTCLINLLTQQRDVYRELHQLASIQRQAIEEERSEESLRILGDRQRLINRLTEVNSELEPYRSRWDKIRQDFAPEGRRAVGAGGRGAAAIKRNPGAG